MPNWVETIETAMEDCPSAEKLEKERPESELDSKVPTSDNDSQG
ncbi:hypothetical protein ES703_120885 [subsurface metagenome]|jgi:hypothetical protein